MPGRFSLTETAGTVAAWLGARADPGVIGAPRRNIAPGQKIAVLTPDRRLRAMRWGIIPVGRKNARGRPVMETLVNVRGETMFEKAAFEGFGRAVVPASGWYEWTGPPRRKTAWRLRPRGGGLLAFAAVWDRWTAPSGRDVLQVATVTCAPSDEVAAVHDRMGVLMAVPDIPAWLDGGDAVARALIRSAPQGTLLIEAAESVDWAAP